MEWTPDKLKVMGTIVLPAVAIPSVVITYLIYMTCSPNPTDGTLLVTMFGVISALAGVGGFFGGKLVNRIKVKELEAQCPPTEEKVV